MLGLVGYAELGSTDLFGLGSATVTGSTGLVSFEFV